MEDRGVELFETGLAAAKHAAAVLRMLSNDEWDELIAMAERGVQKAPGLEAYGAWVGLIPIFKAARVMVELE